MSDLAAGKQWHIYSTGASSASSSSGPIQSPVNYLNNIGSSSSSSSSMNAISFGFVATAILISMFLIMAIFEHLFRPNNDHAHELSDGNIGSSTQVQKIAAPEMVERCSESHVSVVMVPGEQYPTYIALPLPLQREGVYNWPCHQQHTVLHFQ